jgi:ribosomal protein S27E
MSDRKYRQRGYQDEPRGPRREQGAPPKKEYAPRGQPPISPKTFSMPGFREAVRCSRCGHELTVASASSPEGSCVRCGAALHSCAQCAHFDTSAPFECQRPVPARVSPKDARNTCPLFDPRTTVERETKSAQSSTGASSARQAFDDLFK